MNEQTMNNVTEEVTEVVTKSSGMTNGQAAVLGAVSTLIVVKVATVLYNAYQDHKAKKALETWEPIDVTKQSKEVEEPEEA